MRRVLFLAVSLCLVLPDLPRQAAAQPLAPGAEAARQAFARMRRAQRHADLHSLAGAILCGVVALARRDYSVAAVQFQLAAVLQPDNGDIARQALIATLLAGRPDAESAAWRVVRAMPGNDLAELVLANVAVSRGQWQLAAGHYAAMAGQALPAGGGADEFLGALQPLLLAWAQFGAGRADAMDALIARLGGDGRVGADVILQQARMAALAGRNEQAARLYAAAGAQASAQPPVRNATEAIAALYVDFAALARLHDAPVLSGILLRLARDLAVADSPASRVP
jgi:hypothetical protein